MKLYTKLTAAILFGLSVSVSAPVVAQDMDAVLKQLDDALPGDLIHNPLDMEWEKIGNDLKTKVVDAAALPSGQAINARMKKRQNKPWDSGLSTPISGSVKKGDEIQVYFWARTVKAQKGKDTAHITLFIGRNEEPYDNIMAEDILPSFDWKIQSITGVAKADFPEGELKAEYQLGRGSQTVEIGPIYVSTLGPKSD